MPKKDNGSLLSKVALRERLLAEIENPVIMETHGGYGELYKRLYQPFRGVVFEANSKKVDALAEQRPTWAIYECKSEAALMEGVGFHIPINFVDVDPYGEPWPTLDALFCNASRLPDKWCLAVNDGLKRFLMLGRAWKSSRIKRFVGQYGNDGVASEYPKICRDLVAEIAGEAGFDLIKWAVHSSGHGGQMTHYGVVFKRKKAPSVDGGL